MLKYSGNTINKIELEDSSVQKLYLNGNVIYNALTRTTPNRWVISVTSYICDNNNRYEKQLKQYSLDDGVTWEFYDPEISRKGNLFETSSSACISGTQSPMYDVTERISAYSGTFLYVYETYSSQWYQKENNEYVVYHGDYLRMTPEDNVEFSSMTQAQDYEGVWYGQTATITGTDYIFCETNEYMSKEVYQEVSGEYICQQGNKYKKMQQYDRNLDGTTSAHVPPIYIAGDLIESGSTDCESRLPEGYTEVEYIENTGTSYLDTNIVVSEDYKIETEMEQVTEMEYGRFFGCGYWSYTDGLQFGLQGAEGYKCVHMHFLGSSGWDYNTSFKFDTLKHTYTYDNCTFSVDGVEAGSHSPSYIQPTDTMGVFTYIFNGRPSDSSYWGYEHTQAKMYSFKIWNGSGTLVSDLVPCIRTSDNTVGAYDIVNDTFLYPSSTYTQDTFVAGPQV